MVVLKCPEEVLRLVRVILKSISTSLFVSTLTIGHLLFGLDFDLDLGLDLDLDFSPAAGYPLAAEPRRSIVITTGY